MFKLSNRSLKNLEGVNEYLVLLVKKAIQLTDSDFCILEDGGIRTAERQNEIFKQGYSKCDGYKNKSYHQTGLAVDLVPFNNGKPTWEDKDAFKKIANAMYKAVKEIKSEKYFLHYGGKWKSFVDLPHWELREYPQK